MSQADPLTLHPKVRVTRLNKLALILAGCAVTIAAAALIYSFQSTAPAREAPERPTAMSAKSQEQPWYASIQEGIPNYVKPEPAPRVELPKDPQPPTLIPKEKSEIEQRIQQDLAAALRSNSEVSAFTRAPQTSSRPEGDMVPEYGMTMQTGGDHQDAKRQWLKEVAQNDKSDYLPSIVKKPISPYVVQAGSVIPAILRVGINSDLPGEIIAHVRETVYDSITGRYPLIPPGTRLNGLYDSGVAYGQRRILAAYNRMIFPNGDSLNLMGQPAADMQGVAGFDAHVDNHYWRLFGGAILMSIIGAGAQLSQPQESADNGAPSATQILAAALGQNLSQVSAEMIRKNMNIAPTLTREPGYLFNIIVTQDLVLPGPYHEE